MRQSTVKKHGEIRELAQQKIMQAAQEQPTPVIPLPENPPRRSMWRAFLLAVITGALLTLVALGIYVAISLLPGDTDSNIILVPTNPDQIVNP